MGVACLHGLKISGGFLVAKGYKIRANTIIFVDVVTKRQLPHQAHGADTSYIRHLSFTMSSDYYTAVFDDERAASQVVSEIIQESLNAFEQRIDEMFLSTLDVPYATEMALMKVQKLIELAMLGHDGSAVREDEQLEVLVPDGEPSPSTIDSWARGTGAPSPH
jgi:hypothetical protein